MYLELNLEAILDETEIHIDCGDIYNEFVNTEKDYELVEEILATNRIITSRAIILEIINLIKE